LAHHDVFQLEVAMQICSAVHYLHSHSIMHRDLKLENIMMRQVG
jgi:serine/threonine protein kinase